MIDGAKHEIEGLNHDLDGLKCQVDKHFVVLSSQCRHTRALAAFASIT